MSKYIKLEDAIDALYSGFVTKSVIEDKLKDLPTIEVSDKADRPFEYLEGFEDGKASVEVSEDCIDRKKLIEQIYKDSEGHEGWYGDTWKFIDTIELAQSVIPQVPSEDAISREWVKEAIKKYGETYGTGTTMYLEQIAPKFIDEAPSVIPQPKEGEWIDTGIGKEEVYDDLYVCSKCGSMEFFSNYCPNCGSKMKGAER